MLSKKIRNSVIILALITGFVGIETNHVEAKVIPRIYIISNASTYELTYGNIQVTPYSSYESRLDEAKTLVAKAENSGIDSDILNAKNLVDTLTEGQDNKFKKVLLQILLQYLFYYNIIQKYLQSFKICFKLATAFVCTTFLYNCSAKFYNMEYYSYTGCSKYY